MKIKSIMWLPIFFGLLVYLLFKFVLFLGYVPSASMEPTISEGNWIFGNRIYGELQRGDIVIFEKNGCYLVKRIAAVPGDNVYIDDHTGKVSVNIESEDVTRILKVPEHSYFMMGDNADVSIDSRYWKNPFVTETEIQAKSIFLS